MKWRRKQIARKYSKTSFFQPQVNDIGLGTAHSPNRRTGIGRGQWVARLLCGLIVFNFALSQNCRGMTTAETIRGYYHHAAWTPKDGAPEGIWAITQTHDGWLWLGGVFGLNRFDGVKFETIDLRSAGSTDTRAIVALYTTRKGDLWISYQAGGAIQLKQGRPDAVASFSGLPPRSIKSFSEDGDGRMWAATLHEIWMLEGTKWQRVQDEWGLPQDATIVDQTSDADDTLWVGTDKGFYFLKKGSQRFERSEEVPQGLATLGLSNSGRLWRHDKTGFALINRSNTPVKPPHTGFLQLEGNAEILARDGSWWSVDCPKGICRANADGSQEPLASRTAGDDAFTTTDGLSSDRVMELYEDREGNIWAGTKLGLDQFRRNAFVVVQFPQPLIHFSMVDDPISGIWAGTDLRYANSSDSIWKLDPKPTRIDDFNEATSAIHGEADGSILVGGKSKLWRLVDGHMLPLPLPPEIHGRVMRVFRAETGNLWVGVENQGTFEVIGAQWVPQGKNNGFGERVPRIAVAAADGSEWLGFSDNRILVVKSDHFHTFSKLDGLGVGDILTILSGSPMLIGGELGLEFFDGSRFIALHTESPNDLKGTSGLVRTNDGTLWLFNSHGALQISAIELRRGVLDPSYRMRVRAFDSEDGLPGAVQFSTSSTNLIADRQGRLWFAASNGLAWLNPGTIPHNDIAPTVEVQSIVTSSNNYSALERPTLSPGTRNIDINFTALSLTVPSRVSFRAQLLGVDPQWRDFGSVRRASYSNLGPGKYHFQVKASNNDGVWSTTDASVDFAIAPLFYQTRWFYAVCGAAILFFLWQLYLLRVHQLTNQLRVRISARLEERERIARELHDTLLQSTQGLILLFQGFAGRINPSDPMRVQMGSALDQADLLLNEARDRVSSLRTFAPADGLPQIIARLGAELFSDRAPQFKLITAGSGRILATKIVDELYSICREALTNALRHSNASVVEVDLEFGAAEFRMRIADNGQSIDPDLLRQGMRPGHFGLPGMRERAQHLGARFDIRSRKDAGTEIELIVPASIAYREDHAKGGLRALLKVLTSRSRR
jgi:signal transduction histidine kinase/ligand-binding sensor domain-containing protein